jgi:hypothetical protein
VPVAADGVIAAVNVTLSPNVEGFRLDVTAVAVFARLTVCDTGADELPLCVPSPAYCAAIECVPVERLDVASVATPFESRAAEPIVAAPSVNVTVPVGVTVPDDCVTVATSPTDCPNVDGFGDDASEVVVATIPLPTTCVTTADVLPA